MVLRQRVPALRVEERATGKARVALYSTYKNDVIAARQDCFRCALDKCQNSGEGRRPEAAVLPFNIFELVLGWGRKPLGEVGLIGLKNVNGKMLGVSES